MNRVKELRVMSGMQQKEVAVAIGVSRPTVSEWEHQKKDPTGDRLMRLADLFDVPPSYILHINNQRTEPQGSITDDEQVLLDRYRVLSDEDKEVVRYHALRLKREADRGTGADARQSAG